MPLISIVLPTHRREHLLKTALESVVTSSGFDDYEVVVGDNSANASAESVVKSYDDPRVRYFNTGKDLDIYGSWNFAIDHAVGKYTFLFADDDAFLPDGLSKIHDALLRYRMPEYLGLAAGWYSRPGFRRGPENAVKFDENYVREGLEPPMNLLREHFGFGRPSFSPTYTMVDEAVRDKLRARGLPMFLPLFPDYSLQAMALAVAKTAAGMSEPTLVHGYAVESLGEQYCYPRKNLVWPAPAGEDKVFRHSPVHGYTFTNGRLETMLRVQEALPETAPIDIDGISFLKLYGRELLFEGTWRDVTADAEEYIRYIRALGEPHKTQAFSQMKGPLLQLCAMVELKAWEQIKVGPDEWMQGSEQGFDDIVGAARKGRELYEARRRRAEVLREAVRRATEAPRGGTAFSVTEGRNPLL
ncbi:MAG TPA: glycosyltransferase family 2 protein [Polyangiaceae bacterium]|nr:glycosyltransferase family 2 protein [Polyangiaceae bacterium]